MTRSTLDLGSTRASIRFYSALYARRSDVWAWRPTWGSNSPSAKAEKGAFSGRFECLSQVTEARHATDSATDGMLKALRKGVEEIGDRCGTLEAERAARQGSIPKWRISIYKRMGVYRAVVCYIV